MGIAKVVLTGISETLLAGWTKYNATCDSLFGTDGTTRYPRVIKVKIEDGTLADTIKVTATSVYNGDAIAAEDNLGASGDTGYFNLDATKSSLHIETGAITGNCTHTPLAVIERNAGGEFPYVQPSVVANGITLKFRKNDDSSYDLTSHVDIGELYITILYFTNS